MAVAETELTSSAVAASLKGRRFDVTGTVFVAALVVALGLTVLVLATLLVSVASDGKGVLLGTTTEQPVRLTQVDDPDAENPTRTRFAGTDRERSIPLERRVDADGTVRFVSVETRTLGDFLTSQVDFDDPTDNGIKQGIIGSLGIAIIVLLFAIPLGIAAAIYLEEYARTSRFTRFVDINIRNLAGVPSIVYGILGFVVLTTTLSSITGGRSLLSAGITLAVLVMPVVIITSAEAIRAVPQSLREAGYGVGATRWEVTRHHVLPYAMPGILTGAMLSLARALGEAAPLILVGAQTGLFSDPSGVVDRLTGKFTALPMQVFTFTRQPDDVLKVEAAAAAIVILLLVVLFVNAAGILLRNSFEKKRS